MLSALRLYLWIAPNVLLLFCLLWIFVRNWQRQYRSFAIYLLLQLAYFLCGFIVNLLVARDLTSRETYLWVLIVGLILSAALEVTVLYELAVVLIFARLKRATQLRTVLRWTLGALLLLGVAMAASLAWTSTERLVNIAQTLNVVVYVTALGLLFAITLLTKAFSIPWRSLPAGIALGFGIAAAGELTGAGVLSQFGKTKTGYIAADLVRMSAFHICALIWLIYLLLPDKRVSDSGPSLSLSDLESRAQDLQRMVQR